MNKEVIKAMNKKEPSEKVKAFKKWWKKNGYKVLRIIFFPIWAYVWSEDKIRHYLNGRTKWSEARAAEILNYYIPRRGKWDAEKKTFYFFDNGLGWAPGLANKYLKLKDRRFWRLYGGVGGYKMKDYLVESFQLDGFTKEVLCSGYDDPTEIIFRMIETEEE